MRHRTADTPKGHRNYVIIACDVLLFLAMLKWLPVEPEVARGLAVLTFIGILWLTEALHVTVTSLLVPVLAMVMGILPGEKATVVATGGLAKKIVPHCKREIILDEELLLRGLLIIYEKNK